MQTRAERPAKPRRDPSGIQSVDIAVKVLCGVADAAGPISLKELSSRIAMPPSNVHRYLHSLVGNGLISHEGPSGKYDLGAFAARLGLVALQRVNLTNRANERLAEFAQEVGVSVSLSVWSDRGPVVIRTEHPGLVTESAPVGAVLPMLWTAMGMVFLGYLPPEKTRGLVAEQLAPLQKKAGQPIPDPDSIVAQVHNTGFAVTRGGYIGGITGIAAPIMGWQNEIIAAVALVIPTGDPEAELALVPALLAFAQAWSGSETERAPKSEAATPTQRALKRKIGLNG